MLGVEEFVCLRSCRVRVSIYHIVCDTIYHCDNDICIDTYIHV